MRELSVEEKAKAYDMAIEKLRNAFYDNNSRMCEEYRNAALKIIEPIFPGLKESSEDEKFRKYILKCCEETIHADDRGLELSMDTTKNLKNWLEKQGKKVEPIEGFNSEFERQVSCLIASATNKEHEYNEGYVKWTANALLEYAKHELEKQGEQKPAVVDFNAKDWYVSKVDGKIHDMTYNPTDKVEPKFKVKYAGSEYNVLEVKDIAGVTFYGIEDEPNHIDYVKAENCKIISGYAIKENGSAYPTKPAEWSEEDEFILEDAITAVDLMLTPKFQESNPNLYKSFEVAKHWLKSLKDRVQPKQEWSERDEEMIKYFDEVLDYAFKNWSKFGGNATNALEWLELLKYRYTWKPSNEQIKGIECAIKTLQHQLNIGDNRLDSLYDDLKKLREE